MTWVDFGLMLLCALGGIFGVLLAFVLAMEALYRLDVRDVKKVSKMIRENERLDG